MTRPAPDFPTALAGLVSAEMAAAHGDAERIGSVIEALARSLGFTVALACGGNARAVDEMLEGANAYAHEEAVAKAAFVAFMANPAGRSR